MPEETQDKTMPCLDCKGEFIWTAGEQKFFATKGFSAPKRCKPCRDAKKQANRSQGG